MLRRLARPDSGDPRSGPLTIVTTPVRGLLQPIVGGLGELEPVRLRAGQDADLDEVVTRLVDIGYARTDLVEKRGELAVRGGILDVFPPTEEHPVRIEFWGDTVEDVRFFKVADQRSLQTAADGLWAPPCRELLLTPAVRERAKELAAGHPGLSEVLGKLADGITVEGMESFAPVLAERMDLLLDYMPPGGCVLACDPGADPGQGRRPGPHQPGIPGGLLGERGRRRPRCRSTSAPPCSSRSPGCARPLRPLACPGGRSRRSSQKTRKDLAETEPAAHPGDRSRQASRG